MQSNANENATVKNSANVNGLPERFKIVTYELYNIFSTSSEGVHITLMPELRVGEILEFLKQSYSLVDASIIMDIGNHTASDLAMMKSIMEKGCVAFGHKNLHSAAFGWRHK